ncbi:MULTISPECIES: LiaI-LiaF-like domain-containing protein [Sphingobacterium]|uniref:LiaI-LiaF-like domain-containing protein n=1 Tax=Sphingobacterium populi TaxID=1812824 RepID=A0ABW5U9W5_9SPHI|nr:DUF5668 domain-containing protein [Sphingobacterium sp. CFCC 11742]
MNNKIATGIWLVFIGAIILLHNMDIIHFNFYAIIKYWPLAIVSVGISLLLQNRPHGVLISTVCNILICSFLVYQGAVGDDRAYTNNEAGIDAKAQNQRVAVDFLPEVEQVKLHLNGGAANFKLVAPEDSTKLIAAWTDSPSVGLRLDESGNTEKEVVFEAKHRDSRSKKNTVEFYLNPTPLWDLEFNVGAVNFKADFSIYRFQSLAINAGASNIGFTFGAPTLENTKIEINTGASNLSLRIPKGTAYRVVGKNVMSSTRYEDAEKVGKGVYETKNYHTATTKYDIEVNGAANSSSINTY